MTPLIGTEDRALARQPCACRIDSVVYEPLKDRITVRNGGSYPVVFRKRPDHAAGEHGIATQFGSLLEQGDRDAAFQRRDRCREACQAAAAHDHSFLASINHAVLSLA